MQFVFGQVDKKDGLLKGQNLVSVTTEFKIDNLRIQNTHVLLKMFNIKNQRMVGPT